MKNSALPMAIAALSMALALLSGAACAESGQRDRPHGVAPGQLSHAERQRLREQANPPRGEREERDLRRRERMSPEERDQLRRDIEDANRGMKRQR